MAQSKRKRPWNGAKWITRLKRLAIYLRDGLACVWCGIGFEAGVVFTLDHLVSVKAGGDNSESNLVTACRSCNSKRIDKPYVEFAHLAAAASKHKATAGQILEFIETTRHADLAPHLAAAEKIIDRRNTFTGAVKEAVILKASEV